MACRCLSNTATCWHAKLQILPKLKIFKYMKGIYSMFWKLATCHVSAPKPQQEAQITTNPKKLVFSEKYKEETVTWWLQVWTVEQVFDSLLKITPFQL